MGEGGNCDVKAKRNLLGLRKDRTQDCGSGGCAIILMGSSKEENIKL